MTDTTSTKGNTGQSEKQKVDLYVVGLDLRDYFAANALPVAWSAYDEGYTVQPEFVERSIALHAYQIADEMMKARSK